MYKILILNILLYGFALAAEPEDQNQKKRSAPQDGWIGIPNPFSYGHGHPWDSQENQWKPIAVPHQQFGKWNLNSLSNYKPYIPYVNPHEKPILKTFPVYITKHVVFEKTVPVPQPVYVREKVPVPVEVHVPVEKIIHKAIPVPVPVPEVVPFPVPIPIHPHFHHPPHHGFNGHFYPPPPFGYDHGFGFGYGHGHGHGHGYGHGYGANHYGHGHDDNYHHDHHHREKHSTVKENNDQSKEISSTNSE